MIEPKIKPLVDAINCIPFFKTFSSCEGHFEEEDQTIDDRTKADVRFELTKHASLKHAENFMQYVVNEFRIGFLPCCLRAYKLYVQNFKGQNDLVLVIEIQPIDRFESPGNKRQITDLGIQRVTYIVKRYFKEYFKPFQIL